MRKMLKLRKLLIMAIVTCTVFVMTACHGSKGLPAFVMPEGLDDNKSYEITFWAKNDTNKAQTTIYENAIKDFEKLYPNIKVNLRLYTDYGKIYNDVITNITTNTTPNVCITYPDHIATYMTGGNTVVPLDELFADPSYGLGGANVRFDSPTQDEIISKFLEECVIDGKHYAIPYMRSTEACYINKDLVEKLGYEIPDVLTWDYIWEVSEKAMAQDPDGNYLINGQKVMIPFIYKSTDNMMISYLKQMGVNYSDSEGNISLFCDETGAFLTEIAEHAGTGAFSTFKISSYPGNFLNAGQCIFAIDSTAGATWMGSEAPLSDICSDDIVSFKTVVRPIPQVNPQQPYMMSQGPSICVFNKTNPEEVLASWLFAQYMLTNDVQIAYSETEGYVPVTSKAQESAEYKDYLSREGEDNNLHYYVKLKAAKLLLENTDNTFTTAVFNGSASLRDASGALIENVTKAKRRKQTVDDAFILKNYNDVTSLYRLDQLGTTSGVGDKELGKMPTESVALIVILIVTWIALIGIWLRRNNKSSK